MSTVQVRGIPNTWPLVWRVDVLREGRPTLSRMWPIGKSARHMQDASKSRRILVFAGSERVCIVVSEKEKVNE